MFTMLEQMEADAVTPYEYALMSQAVYFKTSRSEATDVLSLNAETTLTNLGWKKLNNRPDLNPVGYHGAAYQHVNKKHIVIAHRGTDFSILQNFLSDVEIAINKLPASSEYAKSFSQSIRALDTFNEYKFSETGHSLASIYAEANSVHFNCHAVTFDSPGCMKMLNLKAKDAKNITNYVSGPDIVNTCSRHPKNTIRLFVPYVKLDGLLASDFKQFIGGLIDTTQDVLSIIFSSFSPAVVIKVLIKQLKNVSNELQNMLVFHEAQMHSMQNILSCFHPEVGQPLLQQKMLSWPNRYDYNFRSKLNPLKFDPFQYLEEALTLQQSLKEINIRYEAFFISMKRYKAGDLLIPFINVDELSMTHINSYITGAMQTYREFYGNKPEIMNQLEVCLNRCKLAFAWNKIPQKMISMDQWSRSPDSHFSVHSINLTEEEQAEIQKQAENFTNTA